MTPAMEYSRSHVGKWLARCPYCGASKMYDTPAEAIRAGVDHKDRCTRNDKVTP